MTLCGEIYDYQQIFSDMLSEGHNWKILALEGSPDDSKKLPFLPCNDIDYQETLAFVIKVACLKFHKEIWMVYLQCDNI